jgi:hypothetical protein
MMPHAALGDEVAAQADRSLRKTRLPQTVDGVIGRGTRARVERFFRCVGRAAARLRDRQESAMSQGKTTTDHDAIKKWTEERGGHPATVKGTEGKREHAGILRLDFDPKDDALETISWEEFFEKFEEAELAFLHQDKTADGKVSRFHKFVSRSS